MTRPLRRAHLLIWLGLLPLTVCALLAAALLRLSQDREARSGLAAGARP